MKPYYEEDGITIYHGDCREILPNIERSDVILADPPYANGTDYASYEDTPRNLQELVEGVGPFFDESVSAITCGVGNIHAWPKPDWVLAWFTPAGVGSGPWGFCCWQPILVYGACPYSASGQGRRQDAVVCTESAEVNGHPCPKPIGLWKWLLKRISISDRDVVLDPFMGSGTTLRAAKDLGRRAIGIEICEKYCEIAAKRLAQKVLFGVKA